MKTLIIYFSKSGETEKIAKDLAIILDADTFEIKTEKKYPRSFIKAIGIAREEFNKDEKPALVGDVDNFDEYDRILLGYPIWFGTVPMAVISFVEKHDWTGKDVYPFCTSSVTAIEKSEEDLEAVMGIRMHKGLRWKNAKQLKKEIVLKWTM